MNQSTELFQAVQQGDLESVRRLLQDCPSLLNERNERQATPLLWAVYTGQQEAAGLIQSLHPEINIWEAAALGNQARIAELIAQQPALLNATAPDGFQPLGLAAFFGHVELLTWLLDQEADPNVTAANPMRVRPIHSAAAHRHQATAVQLVRALLEAGAEVNVAQHGGWTPLQQAADHGFDDLVDLLLAHGADPAALAEDGRTAADMARVKGFQSVVEKLS